MIIRSETISAEQEDMTSARRERKRTVLPRRDHKNSRRGRRAEQTSICLEVLLQLAIGHQRE